jgi:hypothetical protein
VPSRIPAARRPRAIATSVHRSIVACIVGGVVLCQAKPDLRHLQQGSPHLRVVGVRAISKHACAKRRYRCYDCGHSRHWAGLCCAVALALMMAGGALKGTISMRAGRVAPARRDTHTAPRVSLKHRREERNGGTTMDPKDEDFICFYREAVIAGHYAPAAETMAGPRALRPREKCRDACRSRSVGTPELFDIA